MIWLRSALFALIFYPATLILSLAALAVAPFRGQKGVIAVTVAWARFHRLIASRILGIRTRIEGEVPRGTVLVAAKHQSMYETLDVVVVLDRPRLVMKRELADIPIWGRVTRLYGLIVVDRAGGAKALRQMLREAHQAKAEGR